MHNAINQLVRLIMEGIGWLLNTAAALWLWSWAQIASVFQMSWAHLPAWKLALGLVAVTVLAAILVVVALRAWDALGRIATAFWTMALTLFAMLSFVVAAGVFSRGFEWVVASVPDQFWSHLI